MYWLVESVNMPKDPRALPPSGTVQTAIAAEATAYIDRAFRRASPGGAA